MLLYGPPGNGKSLISEAIGKVFKQAIYVPHCIEVEGQVIRLFDPTIHSEIASAESEGAHDRDYPVLLRKAHDPRWVKCRRPVVMMGGELTLDMLDLHFDETSKSYEAPPQMKALGGVCIIDDFGRQRASIRELLNRWIVPMEKNVDWLTLHTGQKLEVPFDEFVIFSTNIAPTEMMDAAHLRRIDYKLLVPPPSRDDYVVIFKRACQEHGLELPESIVQFLLEDFYPKHGVERAGFHPRFLVEHAIAACRYEGIAHQLTIDLVKDALQDLYVTTSPDKGLPIPAPATVQHK